VLFEYNDFDEFVKKNNLEEQWKELQIGNGKWSNEDFQGLFGQLYFFEIARGIEYLCQEFKKQKEQEIPSENSPEAERERERERERIKRKIKKLTKRTNRTPEEETELENLRTRLKDLGNQQEQKPFN